MGAWDQQPGVAPAAPDSGGFWGQGGFLGALSRGAKTVVGKGLQSQFGVPSGIGENLATDLGQATQGIVTLGYTAIHDTVGASEYVGFAAAGADDAADSLDFMADDLFQAVTGTGKFKETGSVVLNDYQYRYGETFSDPTGTLSKAYDHPLSFLTDALTVVTAGGFATEKGAVALGKVGYGAQVVEDAAKAGQVADIANAASKAGEAGAATTGVLDATNTASNVATAGNAVRLLDRFVNAVKGQSRLVVNPTTGRVDTISQALNPARRALYQNRFMDLVSGDSKWARASAVKLADKAEAATNPLEAMRLTQRAQRLRAAAEQADQLGAGTRIYNPTYANFAARKAVDQLVGMAVGKTSRVSSAVLQSYDQHLGTLDPNVYGPGEVSDAMTGLDGVYTSDDIVAPMGRGTRDSEVFDATVNKRVMGSAVQFDVPDQPAVSLADAKTAAEEGTTVSPFLPAPGTPEREAFDAARAAAQEDISTVVPAVRDLVGNEGKVVVAGLKDESAIRRKASLLGSDWRSVDDAGGRARVVLEGDNAYDARYIDGLSQRIEEKTGMKLRKVEWSVDSPEAFGGRGARLVFQTADGARPFELQVVSPTAARILDGTSVTRQTVDALALKAKAGAATPDDLLRIEALKREQQALWGAVTDEVRKARGGPETALLRQRVNQFRIDAYANTTDPFIGRGLDPLSVFRNKYKPLRMRNGAEFDAKAKQLVGGPDEFSLDDVYAKSGEMRPMYHPMMDEDLLGQRGALLQKNVTRAGTALGKDRNFAHNTGQLLDAARYSKDAREVWRIRAMQAGRLQERLDTIFSMVGEYGRPLRNVNDIGFDEEIFVPGLVKRLVAEHNTLLDNLANDPSGAGLGDLLQKMTTENAEELQKLLDSNGDLESFAVPKVVAERMRQHATLGIPNKDMDIVFGTPTRMWKSMVLAGSPRWVVNNLLGNVVFLKLQGGKLSDVVHQLDKSWRNKLIENLGPAEERVAGGSLYHTHVDEPRYFPNDTTLSRFANAVESKTHSWAPRRAIRTYAQWTQKLNSGIEDAFRRSSALTAAERVLERESAEGVLKGFWGSKKRMEAAFRTGLDEKQWHQVVDEVNKTMNDYATASPLVKGVLRPYVAPFWSFYRHAAKTLLTMPFDHPAKFRLMQLLGEAEDERMRQAGVDPESLPIWMKSSMLFTGRGAAGDYRFVSTAGMNPFNTVLDSPANILHPAWKVLFEDATGQSFFTGRDFTDPNVTHTFGSDNLYRVDPDTKQLTRVDKVAPGVIEHLLQQIPQYEMAKDLIAGGTTYDTTTLLDAVNSRISGDRSQAVVVDPLTGEPAYPKELLQTLTKLFGYSDTSVNAQQLESRLLEEKAGALDAWYRAHPTLVQNAPPTPTSSNTDYSGGAWG